MAYSGKTTSGKLGTGGDNEVGADSGTATSLEPGKNLSVVGGEGINTTVANSSGNLTLTVACEESTAGNKGAVIVAGGTGATVSYSSGTATVAVDAAQTQITSVGTVTTGTLSTGAAIADVTVSIGSDADGDIFYRASNKLARLAKGSAAQVLTMNSGATAPEWATAAGGGDTTELHVQTDSSSGSGSEATVDADAGVVMCVTASGARYVQLPAVATDRRLFVKDKSGNAATNNINILTNASEEIDGSSANLVISTNYASVQLVSDGTKWYII